MKFDVRPRRTGKTTAMLRWMREASEGEHRVCVCPTSNDAMELLRQARTDPENALESWQFVGVEEVGRGSRAFGGVLIGRGGRIVLGVDDLDLALSSWLNWPVARVSATGEIEHGRV